MTIKKSYTRDVRRALSAHMAQERLARIASGLCLALGAFGAVRFGLASIGLGAFGAVFFVLARPGPNPRFDTWTRR